MSNVLALGLKGLFLPASDSMCPNRLLPGFDSPANWKADHDITGGANLR